MRSATHTRALADRLGSFPRTAKTSLSSIEKLSSEVTTQSSGSNGGYLDITSLALALGRSLPALRIDGPFGAPAQDVLSNEVAVLVGAGIGVTPFASILKDIWYKQQKNQLGALRRVLFVWINREAENFEWFNTLLRNLEQVSYSLLSFLIRSHGDDLVSRVGTGSNGSRLLDYSSVPYETSRHRYSQQSCNSR